MDSSADIDELASKFHWWIHAFNTIFFGEQPVKVKAISVEMMRVTTLARYITDRNPSNEGVYIQLNRLGLNKPLWELLASLLHEMMHIWQNVYGKPSNSWYHNKEFRIKMLECGVWTNGKGCHLAVGDPFVFILRKHGVVISENPGHGGIINIPTKPKPKGKSKLKKWSCGCQTVRVGRAEFEATCDLCKKKFELAG